MIEFKIFRGKNYMVVDGIRRKPDEFGNFQVPLPTIRDEDLSLLPVGTSISTEVGDAHATEGSFEIEVVRMRLTDATSVEVVLLCYACQTHGCQPLSWDHFQSIVDRILEEEATQQPRFSFDGPVPLGQHNQAWFINLTVGADTAGLVASQALELVARPLKPLIDFQNRVRQSSIGQFGV